MTLSSSSIIYKSWVIWLLSCLPYPVILQGMVILSPQYLHCPLLSIPTSDSNLYHQFPEHFQWLPSRSPLYGSFFFLFVITSHTKQKKLIFWKIPLVMELCFSKIFPIPGNCLLLCLPCVPFTLFLLLKLFMDFPYVSQESLNSLRGGHKNVCIFISVRLVLHIQLRRQILGINWEISNCERKCSITRNRFF